MISFIKKLINYYHTRINYFDILKSGNKYDKNKINLGWCGVFPPTKNGTAAAAYYMVKELRKKENINLFLIPYEGNFEGRKYPPRLDKRIFKDFNVAKIDSPKLDLVVFFLLGEAAGGVVNKVNAPCVIWQTIHDTTKETAEKKLFNDIKNYKYKRLFLTSQNAYEEFKKNGAKDVSYFPLGVNRSIFNPRKTPDDFVVLFLSRIVRYKGIIPLLKSIPIVLNKCPKVKFKIHAPFHGVLKHEAEINQLVDSIIKNYPDNFNISFDWTNYDHVSNMYKDISLLVFPSNNEGFGVPLIEAMSCGIPSIVLNKPPMNEIITDNHTGFCLELDKTVRYKYEDLLKKDEYCYKEYESWAFPSPEDIADKIIYLYENPKAYENMSRNCAEYSEKFNLTTLTDEFVRQVEEIVG